MTGEEHYRRAELLVRQAQNPGADADRSLAAAQVHATLALASATAAGVSHIDEDSFGQSEWHESQRT